MSKHIPDSLTTSSLKSHSRSLRSPLQNSRPKLAHVGSSWSSRAMLTSSSGQNAKDDLHLLDPDEVFVEHTVSEVKTILYRLRSDVDAKQEELRQMVGERYRDLLQASTSIISMSQSSTKVLDVITNMKRTVTIEQPGVVVNGVDASSSNDDTHLQVLQCLAAHLKLLLDSSEHLWRLLERKRYIHAAWLFLLSRVVYRSLVDENSEEGQDWVQQGIRVKEHFPLVQRQWESVAQFRAQISHKATLSLREQTMSSQELCASLLALHLLDSLPLSDALDVFLKQRSRTLQILYDAISGAWDSLPEGSSKNTERTGKKSARSVWDVILPVLHAIEGTVGTAREVFLEGSDSSTSMIEQVLAFTQSDAPIQPAPSIPPELCLSTQSLLSSLPNSNHFLSLPSDIRSYRPFIDLKSPSSTVSHSVLNSKLRDWFSRAAERLRESAGSWLTRSETIKKVWEIRSSILEWLSTTNALDKEDKESLHILVDDVCEARVEDIWKEALEKLSSVFDENLCSLTSDIADKREGSESDISPGGYLLSAPPAPSVSQASLGISLAHSSFQRFKLAVKQRIDSMTPFVDRIMSDLESATLRLRNDLDCAFADEGSKRTLEAAYTLYSEETAGQLLSSVERLLDGEEGESEQSIRRLLFLGRVAQKISFSPLISNLRCSAAFSDECHIRAHRLYTSSVEKCSSSAALSAKNKLFKCLSTEVRALPKSNHLLPSNPSPYLMDALLYLAGSTQSYGLFKDHAQRSAVVRVLLEHFSSVIATSIQDPQGTVKVQFLWDLYFLKVVCDDWGSSLSSSSAALEKVIQRLRQSLPPRVFETHPNLDIDIQCSISKSISHARLLLSPLVAPLKNPPSVKSPKSPTLELNRQKTGSVPLSLGSAEPELHLALNLVKPSARFGSLWVGTTAAR